MMLNIGALSPSLIHWAHSRGIIVLQGYCPHDSVTALADIARGEPQLIYNGGLAPLAPTRKDLAFEKRYQVQIVMLGDGEPELDVCLGRNNRVVVRFLDDRYGNQWRRAASQTPFANLLRSGTTPD